MLPLHVQLKYTIMRQVHFQCVKSRYNRKCAEDTVLEGQGSVSFGTYTNYTYTEVIATSRRPLSVTVDKY